MLQIFKEYLLFYVNVLYFNEPQSQQSLFVRFSRECLCCKVAIWEQKYCTSTIVL